MSGKFAWGGARPGELVGGSVTSLTASSRRCKNSTGPLGSDPDDREVDCSASDIVFCVIFALEKDGEVILLLVDDCAAGCGGI